MTHDEIIDDVLSKPTLDEQADRLRELTSHMVSPELNNLFARLDPWFRENAKGIVDWRNRRGPPLTTVATKGTSA